MYLKPSLAGVRPFRLPSVYVALAAINIATIACSVAIAFHISTMFAASERLARQFQLRRQGYERLEALAAATDQPGNDIFESGDAAGESARLNSAIDRFRIEFGAARANLVNNAAPDEAEALLRRLDASERSMDSLAAQARSLIDHFGSGRTVMAGRRMAAMDRSYGRLTAQLRELTAAQRAIEQRHLSQQMAAAAEVRKYEYIIALGAVFVVLGVVAYGQRLAADSARAAAVRERDHESLRASEERFRVLNEELECRVEERTAELSSAVSRQKRTEVALRRASEGAEAASRAKSEFLANMSHEIRTPMNGVLGMLELALDGELPAGQREQLEMARASAETLLAVINDILDFSKVEAGWLELHRESFAVADSLGDAVGALALRAHRKGLELALDVAPGVPEFLIGDAGRLRQIITNLVGNAIKFTPTGEVVVSVAAERAHDANGAMLLHFQVRDTGIGIPLERQAQIFEAFTQADSSTTRQYGGTGLGLTISSKLVALMGGRIWVESEPARGSTFHFTARFDAHDGPTVRFSGSAADLKQLPVLIVDDNATNRRILYELLVSWGMEPVTASGGREALAALARASGAGQPIKLLLVDVNMPEMDGFELVEAVRGRSDHGGPVIMMLSSADQPGSIARCQQLQVSSYLTKPIKSSHLFDAIVNVMASGDRAPTQSTAARRMSTAPVRPLRILMAEDNVVNQKLTVSLLARRGHHVSVVENGRLAVEATEREQFDVALMDVHMPEMGGFEATAAIRARERDRGGHLPIVAMTARALAGDREACLAAGMDDYIAKPIRSAALIEIVEMRGASSGHREGAAAQPRGDSASDAPVDERALYAIAEGDATLVQELVEMFLDDAPNQLAAIGDAIVRSDAGALAFAAHTLKSAAGTIALPGVAAAAARLEAIGRSGDLTPAADAQAVLIRELRRAEAALAGIARPPRAAE